MQQQATLNAVRNFALSIVSLAACVASLAAEPVMLARAQTTTPVQQTVRLGTPAPKASGSEAGLIAMYYDSFDDVLADALSTPTAAGYAAVPSRGQVETAVAAIMGGMMP